MQITIQNTTKMKNIQPTHNNQLTNKSKYTSNQKTSLVNIEDINFKKC